MLIDIQATNDPRAPSASPDPPREPTLGASSSLHRTNSGEKTFNAPIRRFTVGGRPIVRRPLTRSGDGIAVPPPFNRPRTISPPPAPTGWGSAEGVMDYGEPVKILDIRRPPKGCAKRVYPARSVQSEHPHSPSHCSSDDEPGRLINAFGVIVCGVQRRPEGHPFP